MRQFSLLDVFSWTAIFAVWAALWPWPQKPLRESVAVAVGIAGTIAVIWRFSRRAAAWFSIGYSIMPVHDFGNCHLSRNQSNPSCFNDSSRSSILQSFLTGVGGGSFSAGMLFLGVVAVTEFFDWLKRRLT